MKVKKKNDIGTLFQGYADGRRKLKEQDRPNHSIGAVPKAQLESLFIFTFNMNRAFGTAPTGLIPRRLRRP
jgi:hypothetical protein